MITEDLILAAISEGSHTPVAIAKFLDSSTTKTAQMLRKLQDSGEIAHDLEGHE